MPVGVFPALKLGVLFVKQISKPLAKFLVTQAKNYAIFRTYFIIPPAQFYHWAEVKTKMYIMNLGKPTKVAKLNETMAIELGANLMGELIIFGVAGGCVILEYNRQVAKEAKKEELRQMQIQKFTDDIQSLYNTTLQQEARIHYLQSAIGELARHTKHKLPEAVLQQISNNDNSLEENMKKSNKNNKNITEASAESENRSLIERAIIYYKELKTDKIS
ncbi:putative OPA3-like protein CG13603 [Cataglyphis hispanica]|uniref:putative OPA3-like protein CG13603 n=1 Tax=Cataglyphis hispanica TaxID=1086592 RepID=UPI00217F6843|nr:putative OPA3-like protein CG13603 [Cataglyphis hispanica]XP_050462743.1 putative OPA3-like protein CG13603 [Cataglyphis hispanica]